MVGSRDVTSATSACTTLIQSFVHGSQNLGMLSHAQVVVGAPANHVLCGAIVHVHRSIREIASLRGTTNTTTDERTSRDRRQTPEFQRNGAVRGAPGPQRSDSALLV